MQTALSKLLSGARGPSPDQPPPDPIDPRKARLLAAFRSLVGQWAPDLHPMMQERLMSFLSSSVCRASDADLDALRVTLREALDALS